MPKTKPQDKKKPAGTEIEVEPGAEKRLADILKRALNTPPPRHGKAPKDRRPERTGKSRQR